MFINCIKQNLSWEANDQEILVMLWKLSYCAGHSTSSYWSHLNPFHTWHPTCYPLNVNFQSGISLCSYPSPHIRHILRPSHPLHLFFWTTFSKLYKSRYPSLCPFLHPPISSLYIQIFILALVFWNAPILCSFPSPTNQSFTLIWTTRQN